MADEKPVPPPNCPVDIRVTDHVPMAHVTNVDHSIEFYSRLGFACDSRFSDPDGVSTFAALSSRQANLMVARASGPIRPHEQAILFYMYCRDVHELRRHLLAMGIADGGRPPSECSPEENTRHMHPMPCVFNATYPPYMPEGEVRIHDPDGYCVLVGQSKGRIPSRWTTSVGSLGQVAITVSDVEKALHFYRDILGLRYLFGPGPNLAFLSDGAVRFMLSIPQGAGAIGANSVLYFKVTQIETTYSMMVSRGAESERAPQLTARLSDHELWIGFLRDPDKNLVGIMEEKPLAPSDVH